MMIVQNCQREAQSFVTTDGDLEEKLLNGTRQIGPQMKGGFAQNVFKSMCVSPSSICFAYLRRKFHEALN